MPESMRSLGKTMRSNIKTIVLTVIAALSFTLLVAFSACSETENVTVLKFEKDVVELFEGESERLSLESDTDYGTEAFWYSEAPDIVYVSQTGRISAISAGSARIIFRCANYYAECTVNVKSAGLRLDRSHAELVLFDDSSTRLSVTADGTITENIVWQSADTSVAIVDSDGLVTAVGPGTTDITVSAGNARAVCTVTVSGPEGYELLEKAVNSVVMENPGKWFYHGGAGTFGFIYDSEITLHVSAEKSSGDYLRYRPSDLQNGKTYTVTFEALTSESGWLRLGGGTTEYFPISAGEYTKIKYSYKGSAENPISVSLCSESTGNVFMTGNFTLTVRNFTVA